MPANTIDPFSWPALQEEEQGDGAHLVMGKPSQQLTYEQVETVVNEVDPMGLLKMGCPLDEYSAEIKEILTRRNECNAKLSASEITVIFDYWFYPGGISTQDAELISNQLQALFMGK